MVILLPKADRSGFGADFGRAIGGGFSKGFTEGLEKKKANETLERENKAAAELGVDLRGITDPKMRQEIVRSQLAGERDVNKQQAKYEFMIEAMKDAGLLGGDQGQQFDQMKGAGMEEPGMAAQAAMQAAGMPAEGRAGLRKGKGKQAPSQGLDPLKITPDMILQAGIIDPQLGARLQQMHDTATRNKLSKEKFDVQKQKLERGDVRESHKEHKDFINGITNEYRSFEEGFKPRLMQLNKIATDEQLLNAAPAKFLSELGVPLGVLENPSNELYDKVSQDLLKGLPETFGNRILKVEVENFLRTIPTLMNSPEGRRMITSNMLKLGEMKECYYNTLRNSEKQHAGKVLPHDFDRQIIDQVKPQINQIQDDFVKMADIKHVPPGEVPFFDPSGNIKFVPKEHVEWAQEKGGRRIW